MHKDDGTFIEREITDFWLMEGRAAGSAVVVLFALLWTSEHVIRRLDW